MILFKYTADLLEEQYANDELCMQLTEELKERTKGRSFCFLSRGQRDNIKIAGAAVGRKEFDQVLQEFIKRTGFQVANEVVEEITLEQFLSELRRSEGSYVRNIDEIKETNGFLDADREHHWCFDLRERLFKESDKETIQKDASKIFINDSLKDEVERIFNCKVRKNRHGHPVHYLIHTIGEEVCRKAYVCLMQALYEQKRIDQKRYFLIDVDEETDMDTDNLRAIYKSSINGCVIIRYSEIDKGIVSRFLFEKIVSVAKEFQNDVLTVVCLKSGHKKQLERIWDKMSDLGIVEISDVELSRDNAVECVQRLCKKYSVKPNGNLISMFEEDKKYYSDEVEKVFSSWYQCRLLKKQYPSYLDVVQKTDWIHEDEELFDEKLDYEDMEGKDAYSKLMGMTGLGEAKKVITQAVDYFKVQKLLKDKGFSTDKPTMHMVFAGDPGTAKTTVARLFSRIMAENGILSKGHLVEVGRADLVAKYVGHTAKCVQNKFREASGGVLFCDEIYSLVDDRRGSFGDEAINTMVQEMENHREDVIVILAGYPEKMEQFIKTNPGLKSRIAFHVPFKNYSVEELLSISDYMANEKGMKISEPAMNKLKTIYESVCKTHDFGNGRYVRNCLEQARMNMASRLLKMHNEELTKEVCTTILEEDIELPKSIVKEEQSTIGFVA